MSEIIIKIACFIVGFSIANLLDKTKINKLALITVLIIICLLLDKYY